MKSIISLSICLLFTLSVRALNFEVGNLHYTTNPDDTSVTVFSSNTSLSGAIIIPTSVSYSGKSYAVTTIGAYAFEGCTKITAITIPSSVTSIRSYAFSCCIEITSMFIPSSVTFIDDGAFESCYGLTSATIPSSVISIGAGAFQSCYGLTSVSIPSSVNSIKEYTFVNCNKLTSVTIPENITSIGASAFSNCTGLTSMIIPSSVTSIRDYAFEGCTGLKEFYILNPYPPTAGFEIFKGVDLNSFNLIIPIGSKESYAADNQWKDFKNIEERDVHGCARPIISLANTTLIITCSTPNATIYYTLNGTTPTTSSSKYIGSMTISENCIVKAFAVKDGIPNSSIATYTINSYKVANPVIYYANGLMTITCATAGATIHYTKDGTTPTAASEVYSAPITVTESCTIKAIAIRTNCYNSDISISVVSGCETPVISVSGNQLSITCATPNATIYYTLNATTPTTSSSKYTESVTISGNWIVKAFAIKDGLANSSIATYNVNSFKVDIPVVSFSNNNVTLSCATTGAKIYYTTNGATPTAASTLYSAPITLKENCTVKAIGIRDFYNNSDVASYAVNSFYTSAPTISYYGKTVTLSCSTSGAHIYYTLDGTTPTQSSSKYSGAFTIGGIRTVKAIARHTNMNNSEVTSYLTPYYFDGKTATLSTAGYLANALSWYGASNISNLVIIGSINGKDVSTIRSMNSLTHLNLKDISVVASSDKYFGSYSTTNNTIGNNMFSGLNLISIQLPSTMTAVGSNVFSNCPQLAAIIWNSTINVPDNLFSTVNPNLLLYVGSSNTVPSSIKNIIRNSTATSIVLTQSVNDSYNRFYCPQSFTATNIIYTQSFTMENNIGEIAGWETIALPFNADTYTHETKGAIKPFGANDPNAKHFWLRELTSSGFINSATIQANKPYIISMPNNSRYLEEFILSGNVTFSGKNKTVPVTPDTFSGNGNGSFELVPSFCTIAAGESVYALNEDEYEGSNKPGSVFIKNYRMIRPFEVYAHNLVSGSSARTISIGEGSIVTDLEEIPTIEADMSFFVKGHKLIIESEIEKTVLICNAAGRLMGTFNVQQGFNEVDIEQDGVYIIEGIKIVIE